MDGEQNSLKPAETGRMLPIPPSEEAMAGLTAEELHGLASAVRSEQNRRHAAKQGPEQRAQRTAKARQASQALPPEQQFARTLAAREAKAKRRKHL